MPDFLSSLSPADLARLSSVYADLAYASGLAVTKEDGSTIPIPPVLTPVVVTSAELAARAKTAARLVAAVGKVAKGVLASERREVILEGMVPLERAVVSRTFAEIDRVPNIRVDFFQAEDGSVKALEVNATIPAMQGYSDIAASSFIRAVGHARGLSERQVSELLAKNGSNAQALLSALLQAYKARGGDRPFPNIALCARRNDAQLTELQYLSRTFSSLGVPTFVIHPDELSLEGSEMRAGGRRVDLLYRHIFARRIEEGTPLWKIVNEPAKFMVFNPIDPQLEVKATVAELSAALFDSALAKQYGLSEDDLAVARTSVPWTRRLVTGPATLSSGEQVQELVKHVGENPARYVIKRSWEYGGKAVFLGNAMDEAAAKKRMVDCFGAEMDWPALVATAAADRRGGGFVVQEYVKSPRRSVLVCGADGTAKRSDMYVDYSGYASIGVEVPGWGGVCRASGSAIVNIVGGGGVAPLLKEEVAKALLG